MARLPAASIELSDKLGRILEGLEKGTPVALHLKQRATIILLAAAGLTNLAIAQKTGWNRNTVKQWRNRWAKAALEIAEQESRKPWALNAFVTSVLQDAYRPGKSCTFTPEPVAHIIKIACDKPTDDDVPITHWTPSALAREAMKQKIVEKISPRQVGRFLKRRPI